MAHFGFEKCGFFTITFPKKVRCAKEAGRRFNSLATHVLKRYRGWIAVLERHQDGGIHFHLIVALGDDIRTGFDFSRLMLATPQDRAEKGFWRTLGAGDVLRAEWTFWRATAKRYGFGRHELLPIRSHEEAIARYVGGYIGKHMDQRLDLDKGVRLVRYSKNCGRKLWGQMMSYRSEDTGSAGATWIYRQKVRIFAGLADRHSRGLNMEGMAQKFGRGWAYKMRPQIMAMDLKFSRTAYPDTFTFYLDRIAFHGETPQADTPEEDRDLERAYWVACNLLCVRDPLKITLDGGQPF